jgi:hypothetical protein
MDALCSNKKKKEATGIQYNTITLFLKLLGLQERVPNTSAGSWFQSWMVLFTKEYFPISVFCFLLLS